MLLLYCVWFCRGTAIGALTTYEHNRHSDSNCSGLLLTDRVVQDLVAISKYLAGPGQTTDFMSVYHQIRSTQLGRSLAA